MYKHKHKHTQLSKRAGRGTRGPWWLCCAVLEGGAATAGWLLRRGCNFACPPGVFTSPRRAGTQLWPRYRNMVAIGSPAVTAARQCGPCGGAAPAPSRKRRRRAADAPALQGASTTAPHARSSSRASLRPSPVAVQAMAVPLSAKGPEAATAQQRDSLEAIQLRKASRLEVTTTSPRVAWARGLRSSRRGQAPGRERQSLPPPGRRRALPPAWVLPAGLRRLRLHDCMPSIEELQQEVPGQAPGCSGAGGLPRAAMPSSERAAAAGSTANPLEPLLSLGSAPPSLALGVDWTTGTGPAALHARRMAAARPPGRKPSPSPGPVSAPPSHDGSQEDSALPRQSSGIQPGDAQRAGAKPSGPGALFWSATRRAAAATPAATPSAPFRRTSGTEASCDSRTSGSTGGAGSGGAAAAAGPSPAGPLAASPPRDSLPRSEAGVPATDMARGSAASGAELPAAPLTSGSGRLRSPKGAPGWAPWHKGAAAAEPPPPPSPVPPASGAVKLTSSLALLPPWQPRVLPPAAAAAAAMPVAAPAGLARSGEAARPAQGEAEHEVAWQLPAAPAQGDPARRRRAGRGAWLNHRRLAAQVRGLCKTRSLRYC
jgi:hypothetical protein